MATVDESIFEKAEPMLIQFMNDAEQDINDFAGSHLCKIDITKRGRVSSTRRVMEFSIVVSDKLRFDVQTELYCAGGDFYYNTFAEIRMDSNKLSAICDGTIYAANEHYEGYINAVKEACQKCLEKYNEMHKVLTNYFF
jgi:hypothetical protein